MFLPHLITSVCCCLRPLRNVLSPLQAYMGLLELSSARDKYNEFCVPMVMVPATVSNNVPGSDLSIGSDTALNAITDVSAAAECVSVCVCAHTPANGGGRVSLLIHSSFLHNQKVLVKSPVGLCFLSTEEVTVSWWRQQVMTQVRAKQAESLASTTPKSPPSDFFSVLIRAVPFQRWFPCIWSPWTIELPKELLPKIELSFDVLIVREAWKVLAARRIFHDLS